MAQLDRPSSAPPGYRDAPNCLVAFVKRVFAATGILTKIDPSANNIFGLYAPHPQRFP